MSNAVYANQAKRKRRKKKLYLNIQSCIAAIQTYIKTNVNWIVQRWDHQILWMQIRTFEPEILYKNKQISL